MKNTKNIILNKKKWAATLIRHIKMKRNSFFEMLISQSEQIYRQEGKKVVYFGKDGHRVDSDEENCKWWVCEGSVHDNEEKVSSKAEKYSANSGLLY